MIGVVLFYLIFCITQSSNDALETSQDDGQDIDSECQNTADIECVNLSSLCLKCEEYSPADCDYGDWSTVHCKPKGNVACRGKRDFSKQARCVFCYQTEKWEHECTIREHCTSGRDYKTNCTANKDVMCFGYRIFEKRIPCNITRGHKWSTALILSITLGGFGADRFYLGHWQEGIGKLFSFGGLGVWTLVDALLISIRYLGPADGSFYV